MKDELTKATSPFMSGDSFELVCQSISEGILIVNQCGEILLSNRSADTMFGYEEHTLSGKNISDLVPDHSKSNHAKHLITHFSNPKLRGKGKNSEFEAIKKDGSLFPIEIVLSHFLDNGEKLVTTIITDISSTAEMERELDDERKLAKQYFDIAEVILLVLDLKGEVKEINRKGCEVLDYSEEELIGKNWFDISIEKPEEKPLKQIFQGVLAGENDYHAVDNYVLTKSGKQKLIHWQNNIIRDENGKVTGSLSSGTDITEKSKMINALKKNEEKLKAYSEDLEKQVEERTLELAESLSEERDLGALKSKFVSLASHEFRTPLSTILSSASLIAKYPGGGEMNEKRLKHVDRIKSSVAHLNGILEDFLSLDRLDGGKIICQSEEFDIEEVFDEVQTMLQEIIKPGQTLEYKCKGTACLLNTDKKLVRNILVNLTSNAIKYSPEGKPISLLSHFKDNRVLCEIKDEGIGIPEEDQKHLFERFFRANNTQGYQGTGLGLNIVKRYVKLLKGDIRFVSSRGNGTTFSIEFPVNLEE